MPKQGAGFFVLVGKQELVESCMSFSWHAIKQDRLRNRVLTKLGLIPYLERCEVIELGELPLHCELYQYNPAAPTIIFIPGIGTYSQLYCELLARMSDRGFNLVSVDIRGHGCSGGQRGGYRVSEVVADIQLLLDRLQQRFYGPFGLFGCSLGAKLGLAVAEQDKRIEALLCHTLFLAELPPDIWHFMGWNSLYFSNIFTPHLKVNLRLFVDIDNLLKNNPMGKYADRDPLLVWDYPIYTLHSTYSYPSRILKQRLCDCSSAIIIGDKDQILSLNYTRSIIKISAQPFDLIVINNGSHMLPFDHIDDTLQASCDWFHNVFENQSLSDEASVSASC
ncbi:MAG: alpha/beta fold hydrolase [Chromatiaceae bacterium]|nr:alpha/beta fold hydrolase [Chromatiaceae bacterium]